MKKHRAFTLIELIVAAIVVGLLAWLIHWGLSQPPTKIVFPPPTLYTVTTPTQKWEHVTDSSWSVDARVGFTFYVDGRRVRVFGTFTIEEEKPILPGF